MRLREPQGVPEGRGDGGPRSEDRGQGTAAGSAHRYGPIDTAARTWVHDVPGINGDLARRAAQRQYDALAAELERLTPEQWAAPTECDRWRVRDIVAHIVGWGEAILSFKELGHVFRAGFKRRKELGNIVDAANEQQVDDRRNLPTADLIARIRELSPRLVTRRMRIGKVGRGIPIYDPVILKRANLGMLYNVIFTRDVLMHRIDIARGAGTPIEFDEFDRAVIADVVKDWARRTKADATVVLTDVGTFVSGNGTTATITATGADFCRVMTGRASRKELDVSGDTEAALGWLKIHAPF